MYSAACAASLSGRQRERPWHGEVDRVLKKWRYEETKSNAVKPSVSIREREGEGESSGKQRESSSQQQQQQNI